MLTRDQKVMATWASVMRERLADAQSWARYVESNPEACREMARALYDAAGLLRDISRKHICEARAASALCDAVGVAVKGGDL